MNYLFRLLYVLCTLYFICEILLLLNTKLHVYTEDDIDFYGECNIHSTAYFGHIRMYVPVSVPHRNTFAHIVIIFKPVAVPLFRQQKEETISSSSSIHHMNNIFLQVYKGRTPIPEITREYIRTANRPGVYMCGPSKLMDSVVQYVGSKRHDCAFYQEDSEL